MLAVEASLAPTMSAPSIFQEMTMHIQPLESRTLFDGDILFIRGAERSGGFLEATNDAQRTEQLADINNASTSTGNHGWKQFADHLRSLGYELTQFVEPLESNAPSTGQTTGAPIRFDRMDLSKFDAIVFASNNARYAKAQINAIDSYVRNGGAALFISDGNFGSDWADSPTSDGQFLRRFGLTVNQDSGTYSLTRSSDFANIKHPIFNNVTTIDGEGVSPVVIPSTAPAGVTIQRLIGAKGTTVNNNGSSSSNQFQGTSRAVTSNDAALAIALAGSGRVAVHFDRNTFFNQNGAGTDLTRFDNRQYATNLFTWLTDNEVPGLATQSYNSSTGAIKLTFNDNVGSSLTRGDVILRNRITGEIIDRSRLKIRIDHNDILSSVTVTPRDAIDGPYRLEIRAGGITDTAGNTRRSAIRFSFDT
jgi:hypothetical protein